MKNSLKEILENKDKEIILSIFSSEKKYSFSVKNGLVRRIKFLEAIQEKFKNNVEFVINKKNGGIRVVSGYENLEKYYFSLIHNIEPKTVKEFALLHKTHSSKVEKIRQKKIYFLCKNINEQKVFVVDNEIVIDKNKNLYIVENQYIFDMEKEEFLNYLKNFNIEMDEDFYILYGAGGNILSSKLLSFLNSFNKIYYFGDYDEAGYNIYKNLKVSASFVLPKNEIFFLIQKEIKEYREFFLDNNESLTKEQAILTKEDTLYQYLFEVYTFSYGEEIFVMNQEVFCDF